MFGAYVPVKDRVWKSPATLRIIAVVDEILILGQLKILVVDDTISYLDSIKEILQAETYHVIKANNAESGWELFLN